MSSGAGSSEKEKNVSAVWKKSPSVSGIFEPDRDDSELSRPMVSIAPSSPGVESVSSSWPKQLGRG
jgi:hypothetical protein